MAGGMATKKVTITLEVDPAYHIYANPVVLADLDAAAHMHLRLGHVAARQNPHVEPAHDRRRPGAVERFPVPLFPKRRVRVLFFYSVMQVPALVAIGLWFVFQLVSGAGMLGGELGSVAYGAHIGGFAAGLVLVKLFGGDRRPAFGRS